MKLELSKEDVKKVNDLLDTLDNNINLSEIYTYYLSNMPTIINKKKIDKYTSTGQKVEDAFYHSLLDSLGLSSTSMSKYKLNKVSNIHKLNPNKYKDNAYYKSIKPTNAKKGEWILEYRNYKPYQAFAYKDVTIDETNNFAEITSLGFFDEPFNYLAVIQNDEIWMSITPHEIETMQESIDEASGNVVVFGLGLGYYPFMLSLKKDVKHITIVEIDENVIELFKTNILPQFKNADKISIVHKDAFEYMNHLKEYDYAFVDLWHNEIDGLPMYCIFKANEYLFPSTKFSYWIENSLLTMIRRCLLTLIEESLKKKDVDYESEENYFDHLINKLYLIYKDSTFKSFEEIHSLLKRDNLVKLASLSEK